MGTGDRDCQGWGQRRESLKNGDRDPQGQGPSTITNRDWTPQGTRMPQTTGDRCHQGEGTLHSPAPSLLPWRGFTSGQGNTSQLLWGPRGTEPPPTPPGVTLEHP